MTKVGQATDAALKATPLKPYRSPKLTEFGAVTSTTLGSGGNGNDGMGSMTKRSDQRAKKHIKLVGRNQHGLGLYLFDYRNPEALHAGPGRQLGVMAQEVRKFYPEVVAPDAEGYLSVDYAALARRIAPSARRFF